MEKSYQPSKYEDNIYRLWEKSNYFNPDKLPKRSANQRKNKAFTIVLPPPNVTGQLHVGHTLMLAIEDLIVRFKRMQGYTTLWLPGTDHA
ncbi:MAG: class I tRNA ligase family protein, partial [Candidatus Aenigmarchaeota archaeon]|nr:class I tRNA ligase family protein [Candidatus Aenigmarchaeota archaeon]